MWDLFIVEITSGQYEQPLTLGILVVAYQRFDCMVFFIY